ncbi:unnamed protein product [Psylliodes chrysocephalus]|uniref:DUF4371 domain-containing protein n=1 Tax=Psylliodes chrysocephalus TaxID=3402493 RepID=A0A9P0CIL6_9CUCU|nr:unnamed protein product [Psylliodes chrysocephala]
MILMDHLPKLLISAAPDSQILKTVTCSRTKTTSLLKNFQADSERSISCILKENKFSVIIDETTDVSIKKSLAILVRCTDLDLQKVRDRLLALVEVNDLTAEGILEQILADIKNLCIPIPNLIGFAADNAAVMMGKYNGVQANSRRIGEFKEFQEYVRLKPHKLLRASQTRWLSLKAAVKRTLEQWPALVLHFNAAILEDNLVAASTIHNALNNIVYKLYITFLACICHLLQN